MSLRTPEKIRIFQRELYFKAKAEPDFAFTCSTIKSIERAFSGMLTDWLKLMGEEPGLMESHSK